MSRVLIVSTDQLGKAMAGPAIRCWEMSRLLSANGHQVHLGANSLGEVGANGWSVFRNSKEALGVESRWADVIVVQGLALLQNPILGQAQKRLVVDLYDPFNLEILELFREAPWDVRMNHHEGQLGALIEQLEAGDFFLCASEKQRDYWLGALTTARRINPYTHGDDHLLRRLIDVAPFGIAPDAPEHSGQPAAKGVLPGIGKDARLVIWGGGVYNWFDPLSLLRAWPAVLERVPDARLLFLGIQHPNPDVPAMAMAGKAIELSEELGLRDRGVHFNLGWVPYDRRQDFLLESDLGVSTHFEHLETAFSFRTRILDYIWAGIPVVATEGDEFARWIVDQGTGRVVRFEDPTSIAAAIGELLADESAYAACSRAVKRSRAEFTWEAALRPLVNYCAEPWQAADLAAAPRSPAERRAAQEALNSTLAPRPLLPRTLFFIRREGPLSLPRRLLKSLFRRLAGRLSMTP